MERDESVDDSVEAPLLRHVGPYVEDDAARSPSPQRLSNGGAPNNDDSDFMSLPRVGNSTATATVGGVGGGVRVGRAAAVAGIGGRQRVNSPSASHGGQQHRQQQVYHPAVGWHFPVAPARHPTKRATDTGGVGGAGGAGGGVTNVGGAGGGGSGGVMKSKMPGSRAAAVARVVPTGTIATAAALSARARHLHHHQNQQQQQQQQQHHLGGGGVAVGGGVVGGRDRGGDISPAARRHTPAYRADMLLPSQGLGLSPIQRPAFRAPQPHQTYDDYAHQVVAHHHGGGGGGWGSVLVAAQPAAAEVEGTPLPTIKTIEDIVDGKSSSDHAGGGGETQQPTLSVSSPSFSSLPAMSLMTPLGMPDASSSSSSAAAPAAPAAMAVEVANQAVKGRVVTFYTAEGLDRAALKERLQEADGSAPGEESHQLAGLRMTTGNADTAGATVGDGQPLMWRGDVLHVPFSPSPVTGAPRDVFFFEYGMTVMWGLTAKEENAVLKNVVKRCGVGALDAADVEMDEFSFQCEPHAQPRMANDTMVLTTSMMESSQVKLAISYALAQSTKLSFFEERIQQHSEETMEMPATLATTGRVKMSRKDISRLIGRVFVEKCAANLLYSALDRPDFFWDAPDSLQDLYDAVCEYLEVDTRLETLNARFEVLQATLDMLRDHQNNEHSSSLEWIVIVLIVIEIVIGLFEIAGILGWGGGGGR